MLTVLASNSTGTRTERPCSLATKAVKSCAMILWRRRDRLTPLENRPSESTESAQFSSAKDLPKAANFHEEKIPPFWIKIFLSPRKKPQLYGRKNSKDRNSSPKNTIQKPNNEPLKKQSRKPTKRKTKHFEKQVKIIKRPNYLKPKIRNKNEPLSPLTLNK